MQSIIMPCISPKSAGIDPQEITVSNRNTMPPVVFPI